ncbi:hypothetical protein, partial [Bradyrhizobium sp. 35]|uniref:hypothetical protein n=1 Tax=Bradyrhizobium sp. 35 TaxID=2782670 RepID=UPI001FF76C5A
CLRPAPAYTSIRCVNGRLMSSEWSSIMSTLAEDDSSNGAPKIAHRQSKGPRRYAYDAVENHGDLSGDGDLCLLHADPLGELHAPGL